jgi:hypothetical protein
MISINEAVNDRRRIKWNSRTSRGGGNLTASLCKRFGNGDCDSNAIQSGLRLIDGRGGSSGGGHGGGRGGRGGSRGGGASGYRAAGLIATIK